MFKNKIFVSVSQNTSTGDDEISVGPVKHTVADASKMVILQGIGSLGEGTTGITSVGQYYFNNVENKLYRAKSISNPLIYLDFDEIPLVVGALFTLNEQILIWNGVSFSSYEKEQRPNIDSDKIVTSGGLYGEFVEDYYKSAIGVALQVQNDNIIKSELATTLTNNKYIDNKGVIGDSNYANITDVITINDELLYLLSGDFSKPWNIAYYDSSNNLLGTLTFAYKNGVTLDRLPILFPVYAAKFRCTIAISNGKIETVEKSQLNKVINSIYGYNVTPNRDSGNIKIESLGLEVGDTIYLKTTFNQGFTIVNFKDSQGNIIDHRYLNFNDGYGDNVIFEIPSGTVYFQFIAQSGQSTYDYKIVYTKLSRPEKDFINSPYTRTIKSVTKMSDAIPLYDLGMKPNKTYYFKAINANGGWMQLIQYQDPTLEHNSGPSINFGFDAEPNEKYCPIYAGTLFLRINSQTADTYDSTFIIVEPDEIEKSLQKDVTNVINDKYVVDPSGSGDFTTLYGALKALQGNTRNKTIYVKGGVYDVFEEMGGQDFIDSIPSTATMSDWRTYNTIVPDNTTIKGIGEVIIKCELPLDTPSNVKTIISPINVSGSITLENITIKAERCRYCIHDEGSTLSQWNEKTKKYINVKLLSDTGETAFGCGFNPNSTFHFRNCVFDTNSSLSLFMHTNYEDGVLDYSSILIEGCVFKVSQSTGQSINLRCTSAASVSQSDYVTLNILNSWVNGKVVVDGETKPNRYKIMVGRCNFNTIDFNVASNPYTPSFYE